MTRPEAPAVAVDERARPMTELERVIYRKMFDFEYNTKDPNRFSYPEEAARAIGMVVTAYLAAAPSTQHSGSEDRRY